MAQRLLYHDLETSFSDLLQKDKQLMKNHPSLRILDWGYPLSTYAKFSEKLTLLTP